jgi:hypothetical protein
MYASSAVRVVGVTTYVPLRMTSLDEAVMLRESARCVASSEAATHIIADLFGTT